MCEGLNAAGTPANFLYPLQRNGVGACTNECPTEEDVASVDGHDPADKDKMVCMDAGDFSDFSQANEHGALCLRNGGKVTSVFICSPLSHSRV